MAAQQPFPKPRSRPANSGWVERPDGIHLIGSECTACKARVFPAADLCSHCGRAEPQREVELASTGTLYSYSAVHVPPRGFPTVYIVCYVDLDDGVRVFGQVDDEILNLRIDDRVRVVLGTIRTDPDGAPVTSYKFIKEQ